MAVRVAYTRPVHLLEHNKKDALQNGLETGEIWGKEVLATVESRSKSSITTSISTTMSVLQVSSPYLGFYWLLFYPVFFFLRAEPRANVRKFAIRFKAFRSRLILHR